MTEFAQRRERLMAKLGNGVAVLRSAPHAVMHADVEHNYRQDSDFFYLTGFAEPEAVALLLPNHPEHRFVLFVQPKHLAQEIWTGYRVGVEGAMERYGADAAYPISELDQHLADYLRSGDRLYFRPGRDTAFNQKIFSLWQQFLAQSSRRGEGPLALEDLGRLLHPLRMVKSEAEVAAMRQAADIAAEAHVRAMEFARPGRWEYEVQAEIEYLFRQRGAQGPAYPSIVASGANACVLHYVENTRQMQADDLLLIDAGCAVGYYNSDITRTFPISGRFTPEQKALYEIVLAAQTAALEAVQPGRAYGDFHAAAVEVLVDGLRDLKLLSGSREENIEQGHYRPFYMHRTGHWLGLDVHDVGIYQQGDDWTTLTPGHVVTVEPGLYVAPAIEPAEGQPEIPDCWKGIGIRIEDDVLVTETGHENLTVAVPKAIVDLER